MAHRSSFAFSGDSQEFALPAAGPSLLTAYQPAFPGGGTIVAYAMISRSSALIGSHLLSDSSFVTWDR
jgi:hypothetical protein